MKSELITGMGAGLLAVAVLAGCAPTTPNLDAKFGDAVNKAKAQQTINKDASRNTDPVAGIDGQAANAIIDNYHKVYEAPTAAPAGAIGTVTGGGTTLK
ncbi:MAG: hypothetical protein K8H75_13895 [Sulfuricella sp.]|nr:hypothetical protein [Sulfuricella sp.]